MSIVRSLVTGAFKEIFSSFLQCRGVSGLATVQPSRRLAPLPGNPVTRHAVTLEERGRRSMIVDS